MTDTSALSLARFSVLTVEAIFLGEIESGTDTILWRRTE